MSVIIWDGSSLAVDTRAVGDGTQTKALKSCRISNTMVAAVVGRLDHSYELFEWLKNGAKKDDWPAFQRGDNWSSLVVMTASDHQVNCYSYETTPYPIPIHGEFEAWGSGREVAIGFMAARKDALAAIQAVCKHVPTCGMPAEVYRPEFNYETKQMEIVCYLEY